MSKQSRKVKDLRNKAKQEGKTIEKLEEAVHRSKKNLSNGPTMGKNGTGQANYERSMGKVVELMGEREQWEAAYVMCLSDCELFPSRIPPSQTVGYVPVDLYRKTCLADVVTGTTNAGWIIVTDDGYNNQQNLILPPPAVQTTCATVTTAAWPGGAIPGYGVLPAGTAPMILSDVSENFVADAVNGTEYIMVASVTTLSCKMVPNSDAASAFVGVAHVVVSLDVERYGIGGKTIDQLRTLSLENDAQVFVRSFHITRDGLFIPADVHDTTEETSGKPVEAYSSIRTVALPVHDQAFHWRHIDQTKLAPITHCVAGPSQLIYIQAPTGTTFEARSTFLWQTEEYPSNKVAEAPGGISGWMSQHPWLTGIAGTVAAPYTGGLSLIPSLGHLLGFGGFAQMPKGKPYIVKTRPKAGPVGGTYQHGPPLPPKRSKPRKKRNPSDPPRYEKPPSALTAATPYFVSRVGSRAHPTIGAAAVISDRCQANPGLHSQLVEDASSGGRGMAGFLAEPYAQVLCGPSGGPRAVEALAEEEGSFWKKLLSGAGSALMTLLPALL